MICPNKADGYHHPETSASFTYLWANQHGDCIRVFCKDCDQWTDITTYHDGRPQELRIVHKKRNYTPTDAEMKLENEQQLKEDVEYWANRRFSDAKDNES